MYHLEKPVKISKQLRLRAQEYLKNPENGDYLVEMIRDFEYGADQHSYLMALELIFTTLLKNKAMFIPVEPLKPAENTPEKLHKDWLKKVYEETFEKFVQLLDNSSPKIRSQGNHILTILSYFNTYSFLINIFSALSTLMNILSYEGKFPQDKLPVEVFLPMHKLHNILAKIISHSQDNTQLINKYTEYLLFDDVLYFTWRVLPYLTAKTNPGDVYVKNYLQFLEKLSVSKNTETKYMCNTENCKY